jgi:hypothetical protein
MLLLIFQYPRFPHENPNVDTTTIPSFYGCDDSVILNISSFIKFSLRIGLVHEDDMMKIFAFSFKGDARRWFESLGKGKKSSFAGFIEAFCS